MLCNGGWAYYVWAGVAFWWAVFEAWTRGLQVLVSGDDALSCDVFFD
jgi:hypothetical protein